MGIISKRDQDRIRKHQQETGETAKCFSGISLAKEIWQKISVKYGIPQAPLEKEDGTGLAYWESADGKVRILTRGNPLESKEPVGEITVYARPETVEEIGRLLNCKEKDK